MDQAKCFFSSLFDVSFSEFITPKIIKIVFILGIIGSGISAISMIATAFAKSTGMGIVTLVIGAPLVFILMVIAIRIYLELIIIFFRISDNIAKLAGTEQVKPLEQAPCFTSQPSSEPTSPAPPTGT
jgi:hypothetical protein